MTKRERLNIGRKELVSTSWVISIRSRSFSYLLALSLLLSKLLNENLNGEYLSVRMWRYPPQIPRVLLCVVEKGRCSQTSILTERHPHVPRFNCTILGSDEYFYKRRHQRHKDTTNADHESDLSNTSYSSMSSDEERTGGQHEFDEMIKLYDAEQQSK